MEPISPALTPNPSQNQTIDAEATPTANVTVPQEPEKSTKYWFDDGSVVLQAENTRFRVHRSMLMRHSPIFQDMFLVGQRNDANELVDGCPLVHFMDSRSDIEHLLYYLYDRSESSNPYLSMPYISAKLRLGKKYNIRAMYDDALDILEINFPSQITVSEHPPLADYWDRINFEKGGILDVINLALDANLLSLLPSVYLMSASELNHLLDGADREDGTHVSVPFTAQRACILGREAILKEAPRTVFSWCQETEMFNAYCLSAHMCNSIRNTVVRDIWNRKHEDLEEYFSPIERWQTGNFKLCDTCLPLARAKHDDGRRKMWDNLPGYFGLPSWAELHEQARLNAP